MDQRPISLPPLSSHDHASAHDLAPAATPLISIVDDDLSVRRALRRLVQSEGYRVETHASAQDFLSSMPSANIGCLILDIHLEGMNGFELQERLASDHIAIPIIFITAHDDSLTRERIRGSGAAGYLGKPFDPQALLDAIHRVVHRRK